MPTLRNIIEKEQKEGTISRLAKAFGYMNVRIYHDQLKPEILQFIVQSDPDYEEDRFETALVAAFTDALNCSIEICDESQIKTLYKKNILDQCAPLSDSKKIEELFNGNLEFELKEVDLSDEDNKEYLSQGRELAKPILEKLSPAQSLFFAPGKSETTESPTKKQKIALSPDQEKEAIIDEILNPSNKEKAKVALSALPLSTLKQLENSLQSIYSKRYEER